MNKGLEWAHNTLSEMWQLGEIVHVDLVLKHTDDAILKVAIDNIGEAMDCIKAAAKIIEAKKALENERQTTMDSTP